MSADDALGPGRGWPDQLKEPDFDALRGRDDFKKPVREVKLKARPPATALPPGEKR